MYRYIISLFVAFVFLSSGVNAQATIDYSQGNYNVTGGELYSSNIFNSSKGEIIGSILQLKDASDTKIDPEDIRLLLFFDSNSSSSYDLTDRSTLGNDATLNVYPSTITDSKGTLKNLDITDSNYFEIPDDDSLSFGDGTTDEPFSIICLVNFNNLASINFLSKYNSPAGARGAFV